MKSKYKKQIIFWVLLSLFMGNLKATGINKPIQFSYCNNGYRNINSSNTHSSLTSCRNIFAPYSYQKASYKNTNSSLFSDRNVVKKTNEYEKNEYYQALSTEFAKSKMSSNITWEDFLSQKLQVVNQSMQNFNAVLEDQSTWINENDLKVTTIQVLDNQYVSVSKLQYEVCAIQTMSKQNSNYSISPWEMFSNRNIPQRDLADQIKVFHDTIAIWENTYRTCLESFDNLLKISLQKYEEQWRKWQNTRNQNDTDALVTALNSLVTQYKNLQKIQNCITTTKSDLDNAPASVAFLKRFTSIKESVSCVQKQVYQFVHEKATIYNNFNKHIQDELNAKDTLIQKHLIDNKTIIKVLGTNWDNLFAEWAKRTKEYLARIALWKQFSDIICIHDTNNNTPTDQFLHEVESKLITSQKMVRKAKQNYTKEVDAFVTTVNKDLDTCFDVLSMEKPLLQQTDFNLLKKKYTFLKKLIMCWSKCFNAILRKKICHKKRKTTFCYHNSYC